MPPGPPTPRWPGRRSRLNALFWKAGLPPPAGFRVPEVAIIATSGPQNEATLAGVGPIDVPVAGDRGQPAVLAGRDQGEAADDPLPALIVAVEQFHGHRLARRHGIAGAGEVR